MYAAYADYDYDRDRDYDCDYDCGGAKRCEGCGTCIVKTFTRTYHTARRAHHGLQPGDRYVKITGFEYQRGGKRLGYFVPQFTRLPSAAELAERAEQTAKWLAEENARREAEAQAAEDARKARNAEWSAASGLIKLAGERVTYQGGEYVLGPVWTKSVDGERVSGRNLLCPETGAVLLRWDRRLLLPY